MSRHVVDRPRTTGPARLAHFLRLARAARPVPLRVPHTPSGAARLVAFLRIARGRTT
jgi:hypothetical protein